MILCQLVVVLINLYYLELVAVKSAGTYLLCTTVMITPAYEGRIRITTSDNGIVEARGTGATSAPVNLV